MSKNYGPSRKQSVYKGRGLSVGLVFGGLVGMLIGDPIIYSGFGMILGFAIGSAMDNRR